MMIKYYKNMVKLKYSWVCDVRVKKDGRYLYSTRTWQHADTKAEAAKNGDELIERLKELEVGNE